MRRGELYLRFLQLASSRLISELKDLQGMAALQPCIWRFSLMEVVLVTDVSS